MANNKIKKIDANTFRGMRFLRRLFLNDNEIVDVGRGTFGSVTRIGTIDLARNKIKKIDYQMFSQLNYVEVSGLFVLNRSSLLPLLNKMKTLILMDIEVIFRMILNLTEVCLTTPQYLKLVLWSWECFLEISLKGKLLVIDMDFYRLQKKKINIDKSHQRFEKSKSQA